MPQNYLNIQHYGSDPKGSASAEVVFAEAKPSRGQQVLFTLNQASWFGFQSAQQLFDLQLAIPTLRANFLATDTLVPVQAEGKNGHQISVFPSPGAGGWNLIIESPKPFISMRSIGSRRTGFSHRIWSASTRQEVSDILDLIEGVTVRGQESTRLLEVDFQNGRIIPDILLGPTRDWFSPDHAREFQTAASSLFSRLNEWLGTPTPPQAIMHLQNWAIRRGVQITQDWLARDSTTQNWLLHLSVNEAAGASTFADMAALYGYDEEVVAGLVQSIRLVMHADMHQAQMDMSMWGRPTE